MTKNRHLLNDNGFSLVEMIVSILVTAILMLGVGVFISTTRGTYQMVSTSAKLQEESLSTQNLVNELVMEATDYASLTMNNKTCTNELGETFEGTIKVECIKAKNNDKATGESDNCYYFFVFAKKNGEDTGTLHYIKGADPSYFDTTANKIQITNSHGLVFNDAAAEQKLIYDIVANRYTLVADCVKSIDFTCSTSQTNGYLIHMDAKYAFMDTEFVSDVNILTRNKINNTTT
ncbi:MAG: prepilin-type N-terminal cleavage/methylation domain-containing protein [Lachnospiraceae bacterium]|nr:prepilin-type N-terminal cleavage/methylation domain-containing protein [Lachnospiraceae bacterium]